MTSITLTHEQRSDFLRWLNREKDFLLSVQSIALRTLTNHVTGSLEAIRGDLDFIRRVRETCWRCTENTISLSSDDIDILIDIAGQNTLVEKQPFWDGLKELLEKSEQE